MPPVWKWCFKTMRPTSLDALWNAGTKQMRELAIDDVCAIC